MVNGRTEADDMEREYHRQSLRDKFAAAALTGLLVHANDDIDEETLDTPSDIAYTAYEMAGAMLRERAKTNHDAAPAARADLPDKRPLNAVSANGGTPGAASRDGSGTGGTPSEAEINALEFVVVMGRAAHDWDKDILRQWLVRLRPEFDRSEPIKNGPDPDSRGWETPAKTNPTPPRNGTPAEGSVQGEGGFRDSRNAKEPVAWALMRHGKAEQVAIHPVYLSGDIHRVAPLYAYQPPMLTAAERDAIQTAMNAYGSDNANPECAAIEATLWGLLERTR